MKGLVYSAHEQSSDVDNDLDEQFKMNNSSNRQQIIVKSFLDSFVSCLHHSVPEVKDLPWQSGPSVYELVTHRLSLSWRGDGRYYVQAKRKDNIHSFSCFSIDQLDHIESKHREW